MTGRTWRWAIAPAAVLLVTVIAWVLAPDSREPIRIGLSLNLTGHGGTAAEYVREGAMLAVEEVNRRGGIRGRPVELLIRDDGNSKEGVLRADQELVDAGVLVIVGHVTSENTLAAYDLLMPQGVMLFTPYTGTSALTGRDDLFFRTSVDNIQYGRAMATLLRQKGVERAAFLMDMTNPSFTVDYAGETARHFGGTSREVPIDPTDHPDWESVVDELLMDEPQAVVMLTEVSMTGIGAQKLRARGYTGHLIATLWAQTPDLMRYGGQAVEGLSLLTFIDPQNQRPEFLRVSALMEQRLHRRANARSVRAYDAIMILADALRRSERLDVSSLKRSLLEGRFETLMGALEFDPYGDVRRPLYEVVVKDGRYLTAQTLP